MKISATIGGDGGGAFGHVDHEKKNNIKFRSWITTAITKNRIDVMKYNTIRIIITIIIIVTHTT
jgi:hypothetical protein